jgi:hypothetical protein
MTKAEMGYPVHEQELLALVKMCNRGAHMLRGKTFTANTDHHVPTYLQKQPNLSGREVRWLMDLQQYDIKLKYKHMADFLSRNPAMKTHGRFPIEKPSNDAKMRRLWKSTDNANFIQPHPGKPHPTD